MFLCRLLASYLHWLRSLRYRFEGFSLISHEDLDFISPFEMVLDSAAYNVSVSDLFVYHVNSFRLFLTVDQLMLVN